MSAGELPSKDPLFYGQMAPSPDSMIALPNNSVLQDGQSHRFPPFQVMVDIQPSGGGNVSQQWTAYGPQGQQFVGRGRGAPRGMASPGRGGRGRTQFVTPGRFPYLPPDSDRCYGCGQQGHFHRVCPTNPWWRPPNVQL